MNTAKYYKSLGVELRALESRVRNFIADAHWLTDGEWKESVLRTMLRRNLPKTVEVGRGFVVSAAGISRQIDVLIYSTNSPVLFRDGDLVFVTPDAVRGIIEVKATLDTKNLKKTLAKLTYNARIAQKKVGGIFVGLFSYDGSAKDTYVLNQLNDAADGNPAQLVDLVCIGSSHFIRWWKADHFNQNSSSGKWSSYRISGMAPGYFLCNAVQFIAPESVGKNPSIWFPSVGKSPHLVIEKFFAPDPRFRSKP